MSTATSSFLKKIRMALAIPTPLPFLPPEKDPEAVVESPAQPSTGDLVVDFAERFSALRGKFVFCLDEKELAQNLDTLCRRKEWTKVFCGEEGLQRFVRPDSLHNDVLTCEAGITSCEALVAKSGSLLLGSAKGAITTQAPVLICVAHTSQLVYDLNDWLAKTEARQKNILPPLVTLVTGPSRSVVDEKTSANLSGPREVYCFVVESPLPAFGS